MSAIEFSNDEKSILVAKIKRYFESELDQEIAQFDAEFLLDFFSKEVGPYFYNRALKDAETVMGSRMDALIEGFYEIEKPTEFIK
ncbi:MAG: DUF2164 domain-containing protein [Cellvibrionaceae bacterium]